MTHATLYELQDLCLSDPMFGDSPVATLCNYQTYVLYNLPRLLTLDTLQLNDEAKQMAEATFTKKRMYYNMKMKTVRRGCCLFERGQRCETRCPVSFVFSPMGIGGTPGVCGCIRHPFPPPAACSAFLVPLRRNSSNARRRSEGGRWYLLRGASDAIVALKGADKARPHPRFLSSFSWPVPICETGWIQTRVRVYLPCPRRPQAALLRPPTMR